MALPEIDVTNEWVGWQLLQIQPETMTSGQKLAHQMLGEAYFNLILYRDALSDLRATFPIDPKFGPSPTPEQQQALFNGTRDFFNAFYSSMEAMMGFFSRAPMQGHQVPRRSVTAFNKWLATLDGTFAPLCVGHLERGRLFRTAVTHSAELPPFDWMTMASLDFPAVHIRIFGEGPVPKNGVPNTGRFPGTWEIEAPNELEVSVAYAAVFQLLMGFASYAFAYPEGLEQ